MADNPLGPFGCFAFEIAVFRGQPAIKNRDHFQSTVADVHPSRRFLAAVTRIAFHLNTHGGSLSIFSGSGLKNRLRADIPSAHKPNDRKRDALHGTVQLGMLMPGRPCIMQKISLSDNEAFGPEDQDVETVIIGEGGE
jgi:hypothetical protein